MTAFQETERLSFGSARLFGQDASGNALLYLQLEEISIDIKTELKEAYGEASYPFSVADSHRSVDIQAKQYLLDGPAFNASIGGGGVQASNTTLYVDDEAHAVTSHTATLANTTDVVIKTVLGNVGGEPVYYVPVVSSPIAGVSYTISAGVLTFNSSDTVSEIYVTYAYTAGSSTGDFITVTGGYQNSQPWMSLVCLKRDSSLVDASTGYIAYEFGRVRDAGIKASYKEGAHTVYERSFKAFSDPFNNVYTVRFWNA